MTKGCGGTHLSAQFGVLIIIMGEGTVIRGLVSELNAAGGKTREPEIQDTRFGKEGRRNWDLTTREAGLKDTGNQD